MFLRGNDYISTESVHLLCKMYLSKATDIICSVRRLAENPAGDVAIDGIAGKKFSLHVDEQFKTLHAPIIFESTDFPTKLLAMGAGMFNTTLGTKFFCRDFLLKNSVRFNENTDCDAEVPFVVDAVLFSREIILMPDLFYVAPNKQ